MILPEDGRKKDFPHLHCECVIFVLNQRSEANVLLERRNMILSFSHSWSLVNVFLPLGEGRRCFRKQVTERKAQENPTFVIKCRSQLNHRVDRTKSWLHCQPQENNFWNGVVVREERCLSMLLSSDFQLIFFNEVLGSKINTNFFLKKNISYKFRK